MTCRHENIYWEDLFKPEKQNNNNYHHHDAYCIDCNETKGKLFASKCQTWYTKKIREWLKDNKLSEKTVFPNGQEFHSYLGFENFVEKNDYKKQWNKLIIGRVDDDYGFEGLLGQGVFFETAKSIEHLCQEFKKEKEKDNPNDREREREREQIRRKIKRLEQKTNRTPEEETELENLRKSLRELEQQTENKPFNYLPWILGGSVLVVGIITVVLIFNKSKKR